MEWRASRGPGPIKTQARVSPPTLIILDLSHLSTVCKYINTLPQTQLRRSGGQLCVLGWSSTATRMLFDLLRIKKNKKTKNGSRYLILLSGWICLARWCLTGVLVFGLRTPYKHLFSPTSNTLPWIGIVVWFWFSSSVEMLICVSNRLQRQHVCFWSYGSQVCGFLLWHECNSNCTLCIGRRPLCGCWLNVLNGNRQK